MPPSDSMPEALRKAVFHDKVPNSCFIGRDSEMKLAAELMLDRSQARPNAPFCNRAKALLVTGAPGAGKTTLHSEAARLWGAAGVAVLRLEASDFRSQHDLVTAIAKQDLVEKAKAAQARTVNSRLKKLARPAGKVTDLALQAGTNLLLLAADVPIPVPNIKLAEKLAKRLSKEQIDESAIGVLEKFDEMFPRGWVIMIDEVQQLADYVNDETAMAIIQTLVEPEKRFQKGLRYGNIWMTGLTDSVQALQKHHVSRYEHTSLGGLSLTAATQIIEHHITVNTDGRTAQQLSAVWAPSLAKKYHVWAHHTIGAALSAGWMAKHKPHNPKALTWVEARAEQHCEQLYDGRLLDLTELELVDETVLSVRAVQLEKGSLEISTLRALIHQLRKRMYGSAEPKIATKDVIDALVHTGVIERKLRHVTVPIPSFSKFLQKKLGKNPDVEKVLEKAGLCGSPRRKTKSKRRGNASKKD